MILGFIIGSILLPILIISLAGLYMGYDGDSGGALIWMFVMFVGGCIGGSASTYGDMIRFRETPE